MRKLFSILLLLFAVFNVYAQQKANIEVTVYNEDLALVKEKREVTLQKGVNDIRLFDIPAQIDPTSVRFFSLIDPTGTFVKEQNYEYDLASDAKLLHKYLDKRIKVVTKDGERYEGTLISGVRQSVENRYVYNYRTQRNEPKSEIRYSYGNLVVAKDKEKGPIFVVQLNDNVREISLPSLPAGLITKPTLAWQVVSEEAGEHQCELNYLTKGMSWRADYTVLINEDDTMLDLGAWVTIDNHCGATFKDAKVKLMAGDVAMADQYQQRQQIRTYVYGKGTEEPTADTRQVFEYHLYSLDDISTLKDNQTKQVKLLRAEKVPVKKFYVYDGAQFTRDYYYYQHNRHQRDYGIQTNKKVLVYLEYVNSKNNNLGMPLPKGKARMYKKDEDGSLEFIGEDKIDHTPGNEIVRLRVGNAFDIVGERTQTSFECIKSGHIYDESFEIVVRNQKKEDVEVKIVEHLYRWSDWTITAKSDQFVKADSRTVEFDVKVPAGEEKRVTYTVRYEW